MSTADEPASSSIETVDKSVAPVLVAVVVAVVVVVVVVAAVVVVVVFCSGTWKLARTVRLLSGCTGRKLPGIGDVKLFSRLRRRFI